MAAITNVSTQKMETMMTKNNKLLKQLLTKLDAMPATTPTPVPTSVPEHETKCNCNCKHCGGHKHKEGNEKEIRKQWEMWELETTIVTFPNG